MLAHELAIHLNHVDLRVMTLGVEGARAFDDGDSVATKRVGTKGGTTHKLSVAALNAATVRAGLRFKPDVCISAHVTTSPAAMILRAARGVPMIQYVHADEVRQRPKLLSRAVQTADAIVCVSRHSKAVALTSGAPPDRVHLAHPGVAPAPERRNEAPPTRPTLITVARLVDSYKGHDSVIRALPCVRDRVPDVEWVVVGDGPLRGSLDALANDLRVRGAIRFVGAVSDGERDAWLDRANVFVMPSRLPADGVGGEGFGIVYLEAAAHGLPVVALNVGGARDAVVHGETGILVPPDDPSALADAIVALLKDPDRAALLGVAGARHALNFTWERHAATVLDLVHACSPSS